MATKIRVTAAFNHMFLGLNIKAGSHRLTGLITCILVMPSALPPVYAAAHALTNSDNAIKTLKPLSTLYVNGQKNLPIQDTTLPINPVMLPATGLGPLMGQPLDVLTIYRLAVASDPSFQADLHRYLADNQNETLAEDALRPTIGLGGNITRNRVDLDHSSQSLNYTSSQLGLSLRQPLFRPDLWARLEQAQHNSGLNEAVLRSKQQAFVLKVCNAYFDALRADDTVGVAKAEERQLLQQYTAVSARFAVGLVARTDVSQALAQYQEASATRIASEINQSATRETLAALVGQPVGRLTALSSNFPLQPPVPARIDQWTDKARQFNPDVLVARNQQQIAKDTVKIQQQQNRPKLDLVGNIGKSRPGINAAINPPSTSYSVGLELNVPLYTGGQTTTLVRQAYYNEQAAQDQTAYAERQAVSQTRTAFLNLTAGQARLGARQQAAQTADLVAQSAQTGYSLGVRTMSDVLLAQRNAYAARRDLISARYDYVLNMLQLRAAAGTLDGNTVVEINQWINGH